MPRKAKPIRHHSFRVEVWNATVHIRLGGSFEEAEKWADLIDDPKAHRSTFACVWNNEDHKEQCLWLSDTDVGLISHEATHLALHILRVSGCWPITAENEEALAYLLEHVVNSICERVW